MAENQIIEFTEERIVLPDGFEWSVHNFSTPSGMRRLRKLKFKDFETCVHKWRSGSYHLFELRKGAMKIMAYCVINKRK